MPVVSKHCLVQRLWEVALRFNHAVGYGALSRSWQNYWVALSYHCVPGGQVQPNLQALPEAGEGHKVEVGLAAAA